MANPPPPPPVAIQPIMPPFHPETTWVTLCERVIANSNVTVNSAQFLAVYQALPFDIQQEFSALLESNANNTYADLLAGLRDRFRLTDGKKFDLVFSMENIGDRTPKQFLRHLRNRYKLAGSNNIQQLKHVYARGMQPNYGDIVYAYDANRLDAAANRLEDMYIRDQAIKSQSVFNQVTQDQYSSVPNSGAAAVNTQMVAQTSTNDGQIETLRNQMKNLEKEIARLSVTNKDNSQSSKSQQYIPPHQRSVVVPCPRVPSFVDRQGLCTSHLRFGSKAYRCLNQGNCSFDNLKAKKHSCTDACPWSNFLASGISRDPDQKN